MAKATIVEDLGGGQYSIKRNWAGREGIEARITALRAEADLLEEKWGAMPVTTDEEVFDKNIVKLQYTTLRKKAEWLEDNMPTDATVDAWCADYTEGLTGEVGTIDIAGEYTADVNIQPGYEDDSDYDGERDGELYPAIALGPWTSFLNQCIYPGWQRFAPLHRYAYILEGAIDYDANTCSIAIQPTFSLMNYNVNRPATAPGDVPAASGVKSSITKNYNVNYGDILGRDSIEIFYRETITKAAAREFFIQNAATAHPGFIDFCERNPDHPIANVTQLAPPVFLEDEQYIALSRICTAIDMFGYVSDPSGYKVDDHWNTMLDIGDPWYWFPRYKGEEQNEFFIGNIPLIRDPQERTVDTRIKNPFVEGVVYETLEEAIDARVYNFGWHLGRLVWRGSWDWYADRKHLELHFAASNIAHYIAPDQRRGGDCEDFVLTKMQAIIEAGIVPAENLQVLLCYVVNMGYHAVLGIQTANRGFLISDQISYGQLWKIEQFNRTHIWESFSVATAATGDDAIKWAKTQLILKDVPFEYMDCDSAAFVSGNEVIVEFTNQDWDQPKVIGFKESPLNCSGSYVFPAQRQFSYPKPDGEPASRTMRLSYNSDAWSWQAPFPRDYTYPTEDQMSRVSYAATGENGLGFTVGGRTISDADDVKYFFDHLDIYDSVPETFSIGANYPIEIFDLTFNSLKNGKCIGHGGRQYWEHTGTSRTYRYKISSDTWNYRADGQQVWDHASFVIDSTVYVVGGNRGNASGATQYYGANNFGWGISDYYLDRRGANIPNQTVEAYNDGAETWLQKITCPVANYINVKGWNIEGKGLVGGGAVTYQYDEEVSPGYRSYYLYTGGPVAGQWWPWPKKPWYPSCIWGCEYLEGGKSFQVNWSHIDNGRKQNDDSYLYDSLSDSWTQKHSATFGCGSSGNHAASTANGETVALAFSGSISTHWYDYKLSTDSWSDRGVFGLTVNDDPVWYSRRANAAGAEL